ncbi:hypothetical protein CPB84DRAFT_1850340 [Gymnopilus junonius]|uniref:Uncharacterized protein n=1 Tax=Gymnopilus junonius TaxID=109634 RepID=A0A9P5NGW1_GYMJU|nr:hypothetical protein CPB84DRAFT_1850340 [Gymnopilus junonius]
MQAPQRPMGPVAPVSPASANPSGMPGHTLPIIHTGTILKQLTYKPNPYSFDRSNISWEERLDFLISSIETELEKTFNIVLPQRYMNVPEEHYLTQNTMAAIFIRPTNFVDSECNFTRVDRLQLGQPIQKFADPTDASILYHLAWPPLLLGSLRFLPCRLVHFKCFLLYECLSTIICFLFLRKKGVMFRNDVYERFEAYTESLGVLGYYELVYPENAEY